MCALERKRSKRERERKKGMFEKVDRSLIGACLNSLELGEKGTWEMGVEEELQI